jgi:hypothetical protein
LNSNSSFSYPSSTSFSQPVINQTNQPSFQQTNQKPFHQPNQPMNQSFNQNTTSNLQPFLQGSSQSFQMKPTSSQVLNKSDVPPPVTFFGLNQTQQHQIQIQLKNCSHCSGKLEGLKYECVNCQKPYLLCETCFEFRSQIHPAHLFQKGK